MRQSRLGSISAKFIVLLVVGWSVICRAQDAQEQRAITYISNLQKTFRQVIATATGAAGRQTEFLLRIPGLPMDPKMDLSQEDARLAFLRVLDKRPLGDLSGQTSEESMAMIYREILNDTVPTTPTDPKRVDELKKEIDKIDDKLVVPAPKGQDPDEGVQFKYFKYLLKYKDAVAAYNKSIRDQQTGEGNKGTDIGAKFAAMKFAESQLNNKNQGAKTEFFKLVGERDNYRFALDKLDPFSYRKEIFNAWLEVDGPPPIPRILYYPPLSQWGDDSGYFKMHFSSELLQKHEGDRKGTISGHGGWFVFRGSGDGSYSKTFSDEQLNKLSISMEIKQVVLDHIWLDSTVFSSSNWKWKDEAKPGTPEAERQIISEGKARSDGLYYGRMPLLPIGLIIGRNIKIDVALDKKSADEIKSQIAVHGGGSFLGFRFGSDKSWSSTDKHNFGDVSEAGFEIKAPTIIGYICEVLPKCPASQAK